MKISRWALFGALAASLFAANAYAQGLRQPASARQTAYEYEYSNYYAQDDAAQSPSDKVAPAQATQSAPAAAPASAASASCSDTAGCAAEPSCSSEPSCGCESSCGCDDGCGCGCGNGLLTLGGLIDEDPCPLGEPCKLFDDCCWLKEHDTVIAGWIGQSFTWNTTNPSDRFNGPVTMTDRSNEYQLNQGYLYAEKATSDDGLWHLGGRVDALYGTDYRFTTAQGLETKQYFYDPKWTSQRFYGLALPQMYAQIQKGDLTVKLGHFYSPVGYEVVPMTGNFFNSLPYTFQYGEPFTHTGMLASYKLSDKTTIGGGFTRGWDTFGNGNPHLGGLATLTRTLDKGTVGLVWVFGKEPTAPTTFRGGPFTQRFLQTFVYNRPLEDNWTYVAQSDFGYQNDVFGNGSPDAYWYGLNQYMFKKISDRWTWGIRGEWFRDQNGARVGGFLGPDSQGANRGLALDRFGYPGSFYEVTLGANWRPNANWVVRPNVRFDWFSGSSPAPNLRPYDGGNGNSQTLIGCDAILTY